MVDEPIGGEKQVTAQQNANKRATLGLLGCWRGAQLQVTKKEVFDVIQQFLQGKQQPNSGQLRFGQTGILAEAEGSALRITVHRVILQYSWFLFLLQGHFVAFYRISEYIAHWEQRVLCAAGISLDSRRFLPLVPGGS